MKNLAKTVVLSMATILFIGCGDTHNSDKEEAKEITNNIGLMQRDVNFLTDSNAKSLYSFDKDGSNITNCDSDCQKIWPLFSGSNTQSTDIEVFDTDTNQLAYRNHPLYYFANDTQSGDISGDKVKDVWHLVYAPSASNDSQTAFSQTLMTQSYLTDSDGRALYVFDNDTDGVSNCYGDCEAIWPIFHQSTLTSLASGLDAKDFTTITRDTEKSTTGVLEQTAYKGKPLYYFASDNQTSGETKGDWVKGVWHLVEISSEKVSK